MIKKLIFAIFLFILTINIVQAKENIISTDIKQIINYKNESEKIRDLIENKSLIFETNTWTINCENDKCLLDTSWIYEWDIKLQMKLWEKIIRTNYYKLDKSSQIANLINFRKNEILSKDNEVLYSYNSLDSKVKDLIKEWKFFITSNKWKITCQSEICFIDTKNIFFWDINIKVKTWNKTLREINFKVKKFADNLDIADKFKYKSIQKYSLSCEISASSDILSAIIWKKIEEDELIEKLDKSSFWAKKPISFKWQRLWWNPEEWFVWNIHNAHQYNYSWYWVLEKPIQKLYYNYWIKRSIINKSSYVSGYWQTEHLRELFTAINNWNFVQLWWDYLTNPEEDDWRVSKKLKQEDADKWLNWKNYAKTWNTDRRIYWNYMKDSKLYEHVWLNWEHAFYLLGYEWSFENPSKIIVWDTQTGKHKYSLKEWFRKWNLMQNRSLVINNN